MPAQAPTPRTTRNSRGLRRSESVEADDAGRTATGRVTKRRKKTADASVAAATAAAASHLGFANALAAEPNAPAAPAAADTSNPANPAVLETIREEGAQPTPSQSAPLTHAAPSQPPHTPTKQDEAQSATPSVQSVAEHAHTPAPPAVQPVTPAHQVVLPPASPVAQPVPSVAQLSTSVSSPSPPSKIVDELTFASVGTPARAQYKPDSPGYETRRFKQKQALEGDKFARELYQAIRNDQLMRGCCCGLPNIYNSREEAETATGHLRFYIVDSNRNNLRVLQRKYDFVHYCLCPGAITPILPHFAEHLKEGSRKRKATDSEVELIAQVEGSKPTKKQAKTVERVLSPVNELEQPSPARSMWLNVQQSLATMGASVFNFLGKACQSVFNANAGYTIHDTRTHDPVRNQVVVKRFKRQYCLPLEDDGSPTDQKKSALSPDVSDHFRQAKWTNDRTKYIGREKIKVIEDTFQQHVHAIRNSIGIIGGTSMEELKASLTHEHDAPLCLIIQHLAEAEFGPIAADDPYEERNKKFQQAVQLYRDGCERAIAFIDNIYHDDSSFQNLQMAYPEPRIPLYVECVFFRRDTRIAGDFLTFVTKKGEDLGINFEMRDALAKMIADAKAVHKQELIPSWVELAGHNNTDCDGSELDLSSIKKLFDETPIDDFDIEPVYSIKYPKSELATVPVVPEEPKHYLEPIKGVLKETREFTAPATPPYVPTPQKKRRLAFESPVAKFIPPKKVPPEVKSVAAQEEERKQALVSQEEEENRLRYHDENYGPFLAGMISDHAHLYLDHQREDFRQRQERWKCNRREQIREHARIQLLTDEEKEEERKREEEQKEAQARLKRLNQERIDWKKELRERRLALERNPVMTPETKAKAMNVLSGDAKTPAEYRKFMEAEDSKSTATTRRKLWQQRGDRVRLPLIPPHQRIQLIDDLFAGSHENNKLDETSPRRPVPDSDSDDLEISNSKREALLLKNQIEGEFLSALERQVRQKKEEQKRKEEAEERQRIEEKLRRQEEELRRQEEERQRQEEEQRQKEEERHRKEAEKAASRGGLRLPTAPLISPLSDEWKARVMEASNADPTTELCQTLEPQALTRRDLEKLLSLTGWLNDNIIIGSILHVADYINKKAGVTDQNPKCAAFTTFFYPRLQKEGPHKVARLMRRAGVRKANFFDIETILVPICENSHWTLAVVRPGQRTISHIDSLQAGKGDDRTKAIIRDWVEKTLEEKWVEREWRVVDLKAPKQNNGWDCGVFTITNAMCLAIGIDPSAAYRSEQLTLQRRRLAAILLNGGFVGDFSLDGF
ncbi:hypothetical protein B0T25DRAFT_572906 [Lasiosphaeria hispida]|uniref:Ubiquitin-like protease family profile domain-containing protein n=1 Tax=Lasiosphaeria hispida TaxID=260671 RepID=A0AAJ0H8U2_9PEZI|nr:hypothetical protein B0T25DRAFT_572906 [Lasiosphaeria hispida]